MGHDTVDQGQGFVAASKRRLFGDVLHDDSMTMQGKQRGPTGADRAAADDGGDFGRYHL